jgi:hypothetical protein
MGWKTSAYFRKITPLKHPEATLEKVELALQNKVQERVQGNGFRQVYGYLPEEDRYMRVILLPDGETIENAFYDRGYRGKRK